jgi:carboxyl-terminal processing protease
MAIKVGFLKARKVILTVFLILAVFSSGYYFGVQGFRAQFDDALKVSVSRDLPPDKNVDFDLFWEVWDTLGENYFDKSKLVPSEMVYGAIGGMVSSLGDPYTVYLPPKENKIVDEDLSGQFEGVGIQIGFKEKTLAVISPLPDSPAEKAGIKAGDFIVHIKDDTKKIDRTTSGISISEAVQTIRGPAGSKVTLTLVREGTNDPIIVEVTREKMNVPSVVLEYVKDDSVAHVKLVKFDADTLSEWDKAVNELMQKKELKGMILDLRNNPGGYLQSSVDVASDFLDSESVVVIEQKGDGSKIDYKTENLPRLKKMQVVILVNEGSASASEILAGALRDQRGFKLLGAKSFGKGTVQEPIQIAGGSGLHVTVAKWLTPKGTWVHDTGLTPDTEVADDDEKDGDEQLEAAISLF